MELCSQVLHGEILHPERGFQPVPTSVEVRWDPLTGHGARLVIAPPGALFPPADPQALADLAEQTRVSCPFCPERIEQATPQLPTAIWPQGRVRRGRAVLFPNLIAYAPHASVSVYAPELHVLPVGEMTPELMTDNVATQVAWLEAVTRQDPTARWQSVNSNYLTPERRLGVRHLGGTGRVQWLAAFAPVGPAELRALVPGVSSPAELDEELVTELGWGVATALGLYAELGFWSFNLAL